MNIVILDDYQDAVRKLQCAAKLDAFPAKVYTNTVKGIGQLSVRLKDAEVLVLIRERSAISRALIEKLPRLKLISQTGKVGGHIDIAACTERGIAVAEGSGSPTSTAELTWALVLAAMRRVPQYVAHLKHRRLRNRTQPSRTVCHERRAQPALAPGRRHPRLRHA